MSIHWIYNYLCNQCLSPLTLWVRFPLMVDTTLCDKVSDLRQVCDFLQVLRFLPRCNWNTEILSTVALGTITPPHPPLCSYTPPYLLLSIYLNLSSGMNLQLNYMMICKMLFKISPLRLTFIHVPLEFLINGFLTLEVVQDSPTRFCLLILSCRKSQV
jgi:hypothetical protein